jgi:hypothetical protein
MEMESTLQSDVAPTTTSNKSQAMLYWIVTAIFCLQMSFNRLCSIASFSSCASVRPPWLSCLFQGGAIMGQVPGCAAFAYAVPRELKEWAYAGFAITIVTGLLFTLPWVTA